MIQKRTMRKRNFKNYLNEQCLKKIVQKKKFLEQKSICKMKISIRKLRNNEREEVTTNTKQKTKHSTLEIQHKKKKCF